MQARFQISVVSQLSSLDGSLTLHQPDATITTYLYISVVTM
jgi:hypothetical protein